MHFCGAWKNRIRKLRAQGSFGWPGGTAKDKRTAQLTKDRKETSDTSEQPRPVQIEVVLMSDFLQEMRYHRNLLEKLLAPVCSGRCRELRPSELAHIRRLLSEIQRLLGEAIESIAAG
jgi:hypothetical protein